MTKLYISEYQNVGLGTNGYVMAAAEPRKASQVLDTAGTTVSAAFNADTRFIRIHADGILSFLITTAGTAAATTDARIAGGVSEYYGVKAGDKISIISNT